MSEELQDFCRQILTGLENPNLTPQWFDPRYGLCSNAPAYDLKSPHIESVDFILTMMFSDDPYPFNNCPETIDDDTSYKLEEYRAEKRNGTVYQNPKRLAFLKEHANF